MRSRVRTTANLRFLAAQARQLIILRVSWVGWGSPKNVTRGKVTAMQRSISWTYAHGFGSIARFSWGLADRAGWNKWACDRNESFRRHRWYAVQWSVGVGAAVAPVATRWGSRVIASVVVVDKAQTDDGLPRGGWPSVSMPCQIGPTRQFNSIRFILLQKRSIWGLLCETRWIELNRFPSPQIANAFLVIRSSTNQKQNSIRVNKKGFD